MSHIVSPLYPENDLIRIARFEVMDPLTLGKSFIETGTATAFLAVSDLGDAVKADDTLSVNVPHVVNGKWLIKLQSAVMQTALLRSLFATVSPVLICVHSSGARCVAYFEYVEAREFEIK